MTILPLRKSSQAPAHQCVAVDAHALLGAWWAGAGVQVSRNAFG
jgi:hypothetical protein